MELRTGFRVKSSRQQLERETDEVIQQIVAKAKALPIVEKKPIQNTKKLQPDVFHLKPTFIKRDRARFDSKPYERPVKKILEEEFEATAAGTATATAASAAPPPPVLEAVESNEREEIVPNEDTEDSLMFEKPTVNSFFWDYRSFPHL